MLAIKPKGQLASLSSAFCLVLVALCSITAASSQCSGVGYDLSSLAGKNITASDGSFDYYLTVCGACPYPSICKSSYSFSKTSLCAYAGSYSYNLADWTSTASPAPVWSGIVDSYGVSIAFNNGGSLPGGSVASTTINIYCGPANSGTMNVSWSGYSWTFDLFDSSACSNVPTGTFFGAYFIGNDHSIFGFTEHSVNVLQSTPSRSAFPGTVNTNFNRGTLTIINNPDVMESRVIKNKTINGLNEWWLQEITDQAIFELLLPDNLQNGTFKLTFLGSGFPNNTPIPLSATSLNIKVLSNYIQADELGTIPTTVVNFQVKSSAIQAGISGPTKSGSYLKFNISQSALQVSPTILMSIDLIDPAIGEYL